VAFSEPGEDFRSSGAVPYGQPDFERKEVPTGSPGIAKSRAPRRLLRCWTGTELYLHSGSEAYHRLHHRHPAAEHAASYDIQGAGRDVHGPHGVSFQPVRSTTPGRSGTGLYGRGALERVQGTPCSQDLATANLSAIVDRLERGHGFTLSHDDESSIKDTYDSFAWAALTFDGIRAATPGFHRIRI